MNCKQIREAIDTASRHNLYSGHVRSHLNGCPDCHRYSYETASLLGLLGAQPRVEAPSDFEFRLRARLLREQAAPAGAPQGFWRKMRPETFSWGQMGAAAAALVLVVTVWTFYINRDNGAQALSGDGAMSIAVNPQAGGSAPALETKTTAVEPVESTPVKFVSRNVKIKTASLQSAVLSSAVSQNDIAGADGPTRLYSPKTKRLLNDRSRFYGAEPASISLVKPANIALTF
jgi:hypothetical protein